MAISTINYHARYQGPSIEKKMITPQFPGVQHVEIEAGNVDGRDTLRIRVIAEVDEPPTSFPEAFTVLAQSVFEQCVFQLAIQGIVTEVGLLKPGGVTTSVSGSESYLLGIDNGHHTMTSSVPVFNLEEVLTDIETQLQSRFRKPDGLTHHTVRTRFVEVLQHKNPVVQFLMLYNVLTLVVEEQTNKDLQGAVDAEIKRLEPSVQIDMTRPPRSKGGQLRTETIYTRLRNQVAHQHARGASIEATTAEIVEILPRFRQLVARSVATLIV